MRQGPQLVRQPACERSVGSGQAQNRGVAPGGPHTPLFGWSAGVLLLAALLLGGILLVPAPAAAIELCSVEGRTLMRSVDIAEAKIDALCAKAARGAAPLTLRVVRMQDDLSHCRVTLALTNNSTLTLNALVLTTEQARFQPFHFRAITPGGTGYASASSRILLACDELSALKLAFHWPASLRIGDRFPTGSQLRHYRPYLLDAVLAWSDSTRGTTP